MSQNKAEDHVRMNGLDLGDLINRIQEGRYDDGVDDTFDETIFCIAYLRKLRKELFNAVFSGMKERMPPVVILASVLESLGMQEQDIKNEMDKVVEKHEAEKAKSSLIWTPNG